MNEVTRLDTIAEYSLQVAEEDPSLNQLLAALAQLFDAPIALVSLIGADFQFFKARYGLSADRTRLEDAFCAHVVAQDAPLVVEDASQHRDFLANPLVTGAPHIRFYAGVPLQLNHVPVGAVCVIDQVPRTISALQLALLEKVSAHVSHYLTLWHQHKQLQQEQDLLEQSPAVLMQWRNLHGLSLSYVSGNIDTLFDLPAEPLRQKQAVLEDYIVPSSLNDFNFLLTNHQSGVAAAEAHFQIKSPNNRLFWVKLISRAFFAKDGRLDAIHAMLIDHTANRYIESKLTETNQQMRLLLDASGLGTWDWNIQSDVSKVNRRWCEMLGLDYELFDSSSLFWRQLIHPADQAGLDAELQRHLDGQTPVFNTVYRMKHQDGHWVWIETYGKVVTRDSQQQPVRLAGTHRDITAKKEAELLETKQRQLLSFINKAQAIYLRSGDLSEACREVLAELTEIADSQFAFIGQMLPHNGQQSLFIHAITELSWNERSSQLVELYQQGQLYFDSFDNLFGKVISSQTLLISNEPASHPAAEGAPGGYPKIFRFLGLPIMLKDGLVGMIGLANKFSDYSAADAAFLQPLCDALAGLFYAVEQEQARVRAEEQLKNLAMTDPLTGIPNRRAFIEHCARLKNSPTGYVLAILDIDHFKRVNDTYGHATGDEVIKLIGRKLQFCLRSDDYSARLGGEEFALLIEHTEIDMVHLLLENLRLEISAEVVHTADADVSVTVSIGARYVPAGEVEDLHLQMADADVALYKAKENGRDCLMWF
jgi:diguanylate cyclase (GGDEF)-like protein/PAS domain S-box-containing protein